MTAPGPFAPWPIDGSGGPDDHERVGRNAAAASLPMIMSGWERFVLRVALFLAPELRGLLGWRRAYARAVFACGDDEARAKAAEWAPREFGAFEVRRHDIVLAPPPGGMATDAVVPCSLGDRDK
jgi:hypothetical protein